jgi:hypothetical protein
MHDFALVTEGATDHAILKNILIGYFKEQREPDVHREHPDPRAEKQYGGWTLVLQYLKEKKYQQAFQLNQHLIVQVDTDVAEDAGFDVPRQNEHGKLPLAEFVQKVVERLRNEIGQQDMALYGDRFIFAIGVEQLECWVLPLWFNDAKGEQTANCTNRLGDCNQLRDELKKKNYRWIRKEEKDPLSYDLASREYRKRGTLIVQGTRNPSLAIFLDELNRRNIQLPAVE